MHALRVLDFDKVLENFADHCQTEGARADALATVPSFDPEEVAGMLSDTAEADMLLGLVSIELGRVRDVSTVLVLAQKGSTVDGSDLYRVAESLEAMRQCADKLSSQRETCRRLQRFVGLLPVHPQLEQRLFASLDGDGTVRDEASQKISELRKNRAKAEARAQAKIQSIVNGPARSLLSDPIFTVREGRFVVPLKSENKGKLKGIVHDTSASGATVFVEPAEIVSIGNEIREIEAAEREEIRRVLAELSGLVGAVAEGVTVGLDAANRLDLILGRARHGRTIGGIVPEVLDYRRINLKGARHPLLDRAMCVPLSIEFGDSPSVVLVTGPNTGGKTVALKTVGLTVAMAQSGLMVAASSAKLGVFTQIWADIGDEQSIEQSLSTFSGHIKNLANALRNLKAGALVVLDEVGAGTDPTEGSALARAVLLSFQEGGATVIASTHYGELKAMASETEGFANASMEFDAKSLEPTYRLLFGVPGSSHAMKIAERHGIPKKTIEIAQKQLGASHMETARMIERLVEGERQARRAQGDADRLAAKLREVESHAQRKLQEAEQSKETLRQRAADELAELLRTIRQEAEDVFDSLKRDSSPKAVETARAKLRDLQAVGQEFVKETRPIEKDKKPVKVQRGSTVRLDGTGQPAMVLDEPKGGKCTIQVGVMKMTVEVARLTLVQSEPPKPPKSSASRTQVGRAMTASTEVHLRHMRAEDAELQLEKFLDESVLAGLHTVRIVHGKGEGVLRSLTQNMLRRHKNVRKFYTADPEGGGEGVTIAELK